VRGRPWAKAMETVAFVAPLTAQCTLAEPAQSLMARLERMEVEEGLASMSWASGFPLADVSCRQQTVLVYGDDPAAVTRASVTFAEAVEAQRDRFTEAPLPAGEAVDEALRRVTAQGLPVVLCDTEDNPGAGAASDNPALLRALVARAASRAVVAVLCDVRAASAAHAAGVGGRFEVALGGRADAPGNAPFEAAFIVERITDGRFTGTGPMWRGSPIDLGPMALLRVEQGDVRVIVSSRTMQAADQSIFRHVGIEPSTLSILALKSSVHFRADFNAITSSVIVVR
jgi:microcystin degradation protein MlrC